jgi:hypothetical protein
MTPQYTKRTNTPEKEDTDKNEVIGLVFKVPCLRIGQ